MSIPRLPASVELVDLTRPLGPDTPVWPGDPPVMIRLVSRHEPDGCQVTSLCLGSHAGTHLDAPRHFFAAGLTLDACPLDRFVGRGVVLDVRPSPGAPGAGDGTDAIDEPRLVDSRTLADRLHACAPRPGDFILLWTDGAFLDTEAVGVIEAVHPGLVGTDATGLDPPPAPTAGSTGQPHAPAVTASYPAHRRLLENGVLLAENLCNLDQLGPGPVFCIFLPLALIEADGAPVRAVAWRL